MMLLWMLSVIVFTALLAVAAWWAERALRAAGRPARWVWLFALAAGTTWPVLVPLLRRLSPVPDAAPSGVMLLDAVRIAPDGMMPTSGWPPLADRVLLGMWVAASVLLLLRYVSVWRAVRALRRTAERRRVDGVEVLVSRDVGPAVVGVRHAAVLLPHAVLELDAPLRALVLRHEEEHRRARDTWLLLALAVAVAVMPWNLPLWWIARRARLALEVDCDARVLAAGGSATRYVQVLLLAAQRTSAAPLTPMLVASRTHLERRIVAMQERIAQQGRRRTVRIVGATTACAVALAVACSSPIADQTAPPKAADVTASAARGPDATSSAAKAPVDDHRTPDAAKQPVNVDQPYFEFQVENQVRSVPGSPQPHYPAALKKAKVSGDVLAQFIVDTTGRADMSTFKVLQTNRQEFADAVRDILPEMRFYPAEIGGQKVKQMVQQPFTFAVSK
jgi:beta-lactamase regulating signal transducer with metallopeptidase domain